MTTQALQTLLVRQAVVTTEQVRHAVAATHGSRTTWLEYLLLAGAVDETTVARCAGDEIGVPACSLDRLAAVPGDVIAQLPSDLAIEHRMVPLWVEADGDLCIGMLDPCDLAAVREVEFFTGHRVLREVVPATAMAWALSTYYGARGPLWPPPPVALPVPIDVLDAPTHRFVRRADRYVAQAGA